MADQDLFTETQTTNKEIQQDPAVNPKDDLFSDRLNQILNEDGQPKYKDVQTALDALKASQEFIPQLQSEKRQVEEKLKELEAELAKRETLESFVERVKTNAKPQGEPATPKTQEGLSEEKVAELLEKKISEKLSAREAQSRKDANLQAVIDTLSKKYGDKAKDHIKHKAEELGTTLAAIKELAMSNPKMVLTLLGSGSPQSVSSAPSQSTSSTSFVQGGGPQKPSIEKGRSAVSGGLTQGELVDLWRKSAEYTKQRLGV